MPENNPHLFAWESDDMPELQCLVLFLEHLPYQEFVAQLDSRRGRGRNDYPIQALFWTMIAGVAFGRDSVNSLLRELARNLQLAKLCGSTHCQCRARRNKRCNTISKVRCRRSTNKSSRFVRHCLAHGIFHVFSNSCPSWRPTPAWSPR